MASVHDAAIIARQRVAMFLDMGSISSGDSELLRSVSEPWLAKHLAEGSYLGWLAVREGTVVAGGGVFIRELGPVPGCLRIGRWAHIANIYTAPAHRRRGLARQIMETILHWCKSSAIDQITLTASKDGELLYQKLGFIPTSDMRLGPSGI